MQGGRDFGVEFAAWAVKRSVVMSSKTDYIIAKYLVLQENQQLFATKCLPYLPTVEELVTEIEWEKLMIREGFGRARQVEKSVLFLILRGTPWINGVLIEI